MATPPQVIVAANDDMALGALEAVKARNLKGVVIIGFDALPEALAKVRDGEIDRDDRAVPRQAERGRHRRSWPTTSRAARSPRSRSSLLTPQAITKDNLKDAERLDEVK